MQLDGNEISSDTLQRLQAIRSLFESAVGIWAEVPGAEQNAINDLQSDYALGKCLYWGREAAEGAQVRLMRQLIFESGGATAPDDMTLALTPAAASRVLVVVTGGVATALADPGADVHVFDWDNWADEPVQSAGVPDRFADLAEPLGVPVQGQDSEDTAGRPRESA
jgi:hypothetical protein